MADATWVDGWAPAAAESVEIASTDSTVGYLDIDVGFLPGFGLVLLPDHVAFDGVFVFAHPALEFVVGGHGCGGGGGPEKWIKGQLGWITYFSIEGWDRRSMDVEVREGGVCLLEKVNMVALGCHSGDLP